MVYSITYRRPAYTSSNSSISERSSNSGSTLCPPGVPAALSFERIVTGGTCPPCTLRDFMNYLLYVEFAAENLQFYLWYQDYVKRFDQLPANEKALAGPAESEKHDMGVSPPRSSKTNDQSEPTIPFEGSPWSPKGRQNPFDDLPRDDKDSQWSDVSTTNSGTKDHRIVTAGAFESADVKYQPFTIQPYREEISRVIATYIADGAPRQLNLSSKERAELLKNLALATHPSAFVPVLRTVEWTLKHQAHPNFVRWTICNGNKPRWIFARGLGISFVLIGLAIMSVLSASGLNRAWRILGGLPLLLGISTIFAAWKGMCVVLHGMHHRHLRPWELFHDDQEAASEFEMKRGSWDSFGTAISYEDEPWLVKYQHRNLIRKVFDREVWIREPALRQIQDTIFIQSLLIALLVTVVIVGTFCAISPGRYL